MWTNIILSYFFVVCFGEPVHPNVGLNFMQIANRNGYAAEEHVVESQGYFIRNHRIPRGQNSTVNNRYPILLVPGFTGTSECFIMLDDKSSVGFVLAENGYDVWVINTRGSYYGFKHKFLDPRVDKEFWDYDLHDIGYYDIAATVDYILNLTKAESLATIGHSQGSSVLFIFLASRPEYNNKVNLHINFAPSVYLGGSQIEFFKFATKHRNFIQYLLVEVFNFVYVPSVQNELKGLSHLCAEFPVCFEFLAQIDYGADSKVVINQTLIPAIFTFMPTTASMKSLFHYLQIYDNDSFERYDYGPQGNLKHYNTTKIPQYDVAKITTPCALFYNPADIVAPYRGIKRLNKTLQHPIIHEIKDPNLRHLFYIFSDSVKIIYPKLLSLLNKYSKKNSL